MKKINNKGFTLIEILTAITILGILMIVAIGGLTVYLNKSRKQSLDTMARSASNAAEQYIMDSAINYIEYCSPEDAAANKCSVPSKSNIKIEDIVAHKADAESKLLALAKDETAGYFISYDELVEDGYLENAKDPNDPGQKCDGRVIVFYEAPTEEGQLDKYSYIVYEWCASYSARYIFYYGYQKEKKKVVVDGKNEIEEIDVLKPMTDVTIDQKYLFPRPTK